MSNTHALNHARHLHEAGLPVPEIKRILVRMTTARERREIIAALDAPVAIAA